MAENRVSQFTFDEIEEKLGTIKYLNPSGLAHYDEKIKEVINGKDKLKGDTLYYDEEKSELQLKSGDNILSSVTIHDGLKIVTWADGTYDEIKAMLSAHYAGIIDISDYWSVGDTRTIPISAISATGVGETQSAQNAQVV